MAATHAREKGRWGSWCYQQVEISPPGSGAQCGQRRARPEGSDMATCNVNSEQCEPCCHSNTYLFLVLQWHKSDGGGSLVKHSPICFWWRSRFVSLWSFLHLFSQAGQHCIRLSLWVMISTLFWMSECCVQPKRYWVSESNSNININIYLSNVVIKFWQRYIRNT